MRLRIGWYAVTDSVVIRDSETEAEVEVPRAGRERFIRDVKDGRLDSPWLHPTDEPLQGSEAASREERVR